MLPTTSTRKPELPTTTLDIGRAASELSVGGGTQPPLVRKCQATLVLSLERLSMIATAHVNFDRDYFELQYDEWLRHRSKYKRYEIWFALALLLFGLALAVTFPDNWLVGGLFVCVGVYEFAMAATHRRRWVGARISSVREGKAVDLAFGTDFLTSTSTNGTATTRLTGFAGFTPASEGFFLIPENGLSIYIPRAAVEPGDSYSTLVELLASSINARG